MRQNAGTSDRTLSRTGTPKSPVTGSHNGTSSATAKASKTPKSPVRGSVNGTSSATAKASKTPKRIYTRKGDQGSTSLLYGGTVAKDHPRIEACGAVDEAVASLGLARALGFKADGLADLILRLQRELFVVGAEVAAAPENRGKLEEEVSKASAAMVAAAEAEIDRMTRVSPLPDYFVVPGQTPAGAALDVARAAVRRAERRVAALDEDASGDGFALRYLNRLSDLLFVAARLEEYANNAPAPPSRPPLGP